MARMLHNLFNYVLAERHVGWLQFSVITNQAAMSILLQVFVQISLQFSGINAKGYNQDSNESCMLFFFFKLLKMSRVAVSIYIPSSMYE